MLWLKAFSTFRKYFASPFWIIIMAMRQIPLRLLNFSVRISFQFNEHHLLSASQGCMWSQNYKYLETQASKSGGGKVQRDSVRLSQICLSQMLYFLLYLLPYRVSVTCQIKKLEQSIGSKPDKYTRRAFG